MMPGAFIYILKMLPYFRFKSLGTLYLYVLFFFDLILSLVYQSTEYIYIILFTVCSVILSLAIELSAWKNPRIMLRTFQIIQEQKSIFIFPILEEFHFRWMIFLIGKTIGITLVSYVLISGLAFGISHLPYLGYRSVYKVIQGIIFAILFLKYGILISIICHFLFNTFVYFYRQQE